MAWIQERTKKKNGREIKTYTALIRVKGYPSMSATFERLTDAKDWAADKESQMRRGKHITDVESKKHTFADLINRYIENELKQRKSDQKKFETQLNWWKQKIGAYLLSGITPALLGEYRDELQKEPFKYKKDDKDKIQPVFRSNATINRYMASLSVVFSIAVKEWGWMDENPMLKVKKRKEPNGRVRRLSEDEEKALLKACKDSSCSYLYIIVVLALSTASRFSEIMNLRWQDVDFENRMLRLINTKNGENRPAGLSEYPYELLLAHSKVRQINSVFVFPRKDGKKPLELRKHWYKALKASKVQDFRFHDTRHTAASNLAMTGASNRVLSEVLGHKTLQMVKRYSHLTANYTGEILEKMNAKQFANIEKI